MVVCGDEVVVAAARNVATTGDAAAAIGIMAMDFLWLWLGLWLRLLFGCSGA